jgi:two-component system OmpR family response regulator
VHRLRKKIEPSGVRIITVRGLGYCLEKAAPPAHANSAANTHAPSSGAEPRQPVEPAPPSAAPSSSAMPASHHYK